jgi:DNA-binding IclR family transcriptional regulator
MGAVPVAVPSVERAVALLRYLEENAEASACTVSQLARALGLHKSTCSNILRTLDAAGFVEYDPSSKSYRLGPELIGLGVKAGARREFPATGMPQIEALVRQTGVTCVAFEQLPNAEFVIVGKIDSPKDIKVTIDVGQHFPPAAPVFARVALAWSDAAEAEAYFARWGLPRYTGTTKIDLSEIQQELSRVRAQGYCLSRGEYYAANTAIAAPVFSARDVVPRGLCLVAFNSEVTDAEAVRLGERVSQAANTITQVLGGRAPFRGLEA